MLTRPPPPMEGGYSPMNAWSLQGRHAVSPVKDSLATFASRDVASTLPYRMTPTRRKVTDVQNAAANPAAFEGTA